LEDVLRYGYVSATIACAAAATLSGQRLKFTPQQQLAATANAVRNSSTLFVSKSAR
jgi:hypothetical protein